MADQRVRALLERLAVPPQREGFFESFWVRAESDARRAARRWRFATVAVSAVALAAATSAGVLALGRGGSTVVDRTLSCPVPDAGGVNVLQLVARLSGSPGYTLNGNTLPLPATVELDQGRTMFISQGKPYIVATAYAGASPSLRDGYTFDTSVCAPAKPIPLSSTGLPAPWVYRGAHGGDITRACWLASRITVRLWVRLDSKHRPLSAILALRSGAKQRPVALVRWTPTLMRAWVDTSYCHPSTTP